MPSPISQLYQPLIARQIQAFPAAARRFRKNHSAAELFEAVGRFAILAFSPSQHGKHSVISCDSAWTLREALRDDFDELVIECGTYAALSRQPWSEPPITQPPQIGADHPKDLEELRAAIRDGDHQRGERWLASRLTDRELVGDFFRVASEDLSDQGHKLLVATAAWSLARVLGEQGRFATLRVALREWTAYRGEPEPVCEAALETGELLERLIEHLEASRGATLAFHRIALLEAAMRASEWSRDHEIERRIAASLAAHLESPPVDSSPAKSGRPLVPPLYRLARDYGEYLQSHAIAQRLRPRFPAIDFDRMIRSARFNLDFGPSFEEWSFA